MTETLLSDGERNFLIDGIRSNLRIDGRQRLEVAPFRLELGILPYCVCSAAVTLHATKVVVGLKLEIDAPDPEQPSLGFVHCSVRHSPSAAHWKKKHEVEAMDFDVSRALQNVLGNCNGIDLAELCVIRNRLCWAIYVDAVVLEDRGNVFDALCLGSTACFKTLRIPSLNVKNAEQCSTARGGDNVAGRGRPADTLSLFQNTEITKKATIFKMQQLRRHRASKFSGQEMPFRDAAALHSAPSQEALPPPESRDIAEIEFDIERGRSGQPLKGRDMLPIVVTMAILDDSRCFVVDPLCEEELCCDLLIRIAVFSNGEISVMKYGETAIDPLLIFQMIESGKESGLQWMRQMEGALAPGEDAAVSEQNDGGVDALKISAFELRKEDEEGAELEMRRQLGALRFVTESLRREHSADPDAAETARRVEAPAQSPRAVSDGDDEDADLLLVD